MRAASSSSAKKEDNTMQHTASSKVLFVISPRKKKGFFSRMEVKTFFFGRNFKQFPFACFALRLLAKCLLRERERSRARRRCDLERISPKARE